MAYDNWEPGEINTKFGAVEKNFNQFREDTTILAGYYEQYFRVDGSYRVRAKSISFAKMENEEFSNLYNKTLTVLIKNVYKGKLSPEELDVIVEKYLEFA